MEAAMGAAKLPPGITERNGSYQAKVWDKDLPATEKRRTAGGYRVGTFPTPAAAKAWKRDTETALANGRLAAPSSRTTRDACDEWLRKAKAGELLKPDGKPYKPSVLRTYEHDLTTHIIPTLGHIKLTKLARRDVQQMIDTLVGSKKLSGSKIRNIVMPLRAVCRRELRADNLIVNPTTNLELPPPAGIRKRAASPDEAQQLLDALTDPLVKIVYALAFFTGMRRGELRALRICDVDLDHNIISVVRSWDDKEGVIDPKSAAGTRTIPIAAPLRLLLLEHLARLPWSGDPEGLLLGRAPSVPFTPTHTSDLAEKAWKADNLRREEQERPLINPICLHECRHTFVSFWVAAGFSLEEIAPYAGHTAASMVARYAHLLPGHEAAAGERFDAYLAAPRASQGR